MGVDYGGAGDQGIMFGYATDESEDYMPYPISIANRLAKQLSEVRKNGKIPCLKSDGKVQVTVEYVNDEPFRIDNRKNNNGRYLWRNGTSWRWCFFW